MSGVPPPPNAYAGSDYSAKPQQSEAGLATLPEDVNPGAFEDLHRKTKEIFPQSFEGARLVIQKGLSNYFQISHTLVMSALQPSGYKFGATYVGGHQFGPTESYPVLMGEMDLSGNFSANVIHQFSKSLRCKFVSQVQNHKWMASQLTTDYRGREFTTSLTVGNLDPIKDSGLVVAQYLQSITRRLAAGAELIYQRDSNFPGKQLAVFSLGTRYSADNWQVSSTLTPMAGSLKLCYYQKATDNLQIGVELDGSLQSQECTTTVGYQFDLPKAEILFKGQIDSNLCISATMEKKLQPLPFLFTLSGFANHLKGVYRFGVGITVG